MNDDLKNLQETLTRLKEMASELKKSVTDEEKIQKQEQRSWHNDEDNPALDVQDKLVRLKVKFNN